MNWYSVFLLSTPWKQTKLRHYFSDALQIELPQICFNEFAFICFNERLLKTMFFIWSLNFCPCFFVHEEKRLGKKTKVNLKIYGATAWEKKSYNKHVAQNLKK